MDFYSVAGSMPFTHGHISWISKQLAMHLYTLFLTLSAHTTKRLTCAQAQEKNFELKITAELGTSKNFLIQRWHALLTLKEPSLLLKIIKNFQSEHL